MNYIKQQHAKGFTKDEIREQLLTAGWEQNTVDKYLTEILVKQQNFEESTETVELFARYGKFLTAGEEIKFKYTIGFYIIVITTKRLILLRKFPKQLIEFNLETIEIVEYYTNVKTMKGLWAAGYILGGILFYFFQDIFWNRLSLLIPPAQSMLDLNIFFGLNILSVIILVYVIVMGTIDLCSFLLSFLGRVRIMPKGIGPTDIITTMKPDVEEFIQTMQEKIGHT